MFLFAGYFPKIVTPKDEWLKAPQVKEIWSVSTCLSDGPPNWIDRWQHNDLWLYDTAALAESLVPPTERGRYRIVAYRIWGRMFDKGLQVDLAADVKEASGPEEEFKR